MAIQTPTHTQILNRIRADIAGKLPGSDPTIFGSFVRALADSLGGRVYDMVLLFKQLEKELFPQTASKEYLERWASYEGLTRKVATISSGLISIIGPIDTVIPAGTQFTNSTSGIYSVLTGRTLTTQYYNIDSLTRLGPTVTAITSGAHNLATGMNVTISGSNQAISLSCSGTTATAATVGDHHLSTGNSVTIFDADITDYNGTFSVTATPTSSTFEYTVSVPDLAPSAGFRSVPEYNGTFNIIVTSLVSFNYTILTNPPLSVSGASLSWVGHYTSIESIATGALTNLASGALLLPVTPIGGVQAIVQFDGIVGGTDTELDESLKLRVLQSRSNPVANFNPASIEKLVLSVPGVTRVKVKRTYNAELKTESVGDVTILFLRDNDDNPIPSGAAIQQIKDIIYPIVPATSSTDDVYILAPTPVIQNFVFSEITPDTPTMRDAIKNNLIAFFEDEVTLEATVTRDKYRSAIANTVDPANGDELISFDLTTPTSDIDVEDLEIGLLGTVQFE